MHCSTLFEPEEVPGSDFTSLFTSTSLGSTPFSFSILLIGITVTCLADDVLRSSSVLFRYTLVALIGADTLAVVLNVLVGTEFDSVTLDLILEEVASPDEEETGGTITTCS